MMKCKKIISLIILVLMIFTMNITNYCFAVDSNNATAEGFKTTTFTGTFVQPWVYAKWSDERAENEFKKMKEYGVDTLIMGDTAGKNDKWGVEYPSKLPEFEGANCAKDNVKLLLDLCKKHDIKLYLGLGVDNVWWNSDLSQDSAGKWFEEAMTISGKIARELYDLYKDEYKDTFYGFYSVYEIWNHGSWNTDASRKSYVNNLSKGFNILIDEINKIDPNMPLVFSPFSTNPGKDGTGLATKENTQKFYTEFFSATNFRKIDAFSPMDNCGGGGQTVETLEEWTIAYGTAVKNGGDKLQFWSNCESFIQPKDKGGIWATSPVKRYAEQVKITSKYVTKILNFSYPHYMSPYNMIEGYDKSYLSYLRTGELETTPPSLPKKVQTSIIDETLVVKWTPSTDDYGIAQYIIEKISSASTERKFEEFTKNLIAGENGSGLQPKIKTSFTDKYYNKNAKTAYKITVMDCTGNLSEPCFIVVDGQSPDNGVNLDTDDGEKGYLTQSEFDKVDLKKSGTDKKSDSKMLLYVISASVIIIAIAAVAVILVIFKKKQKTQKK